MSKTNSLFHIVFCTKNRRLTIPFDKRDELYRYIWRITEDMGCKLIRIGGIQNHVHLLVDLNPSLALAHYVRQVKALSSRWVHVTGNFANFDKWAEGYFAASVSYETRGALIEYINNQPDHHLSQPFAVELSKLFARVGFYLNDNDMV